MMIWIQPHTVRLMLSPEDVEAWQKRARWYGESAARLDATFDRRGLLEHDGFGSESVEAFNAITFDHLVPYLPPSHECYEAAIGQFRSAARR